MSAHSSIVQKQITKKKNTEVRALPAPDTILVHLLLAPYPPGRALADLF